MRMVLSFIYYLLRSSSLKDEFIVAKYKRLTIAEERSANETLLFVFRQDFRVQYIRQLILKIKLEQVFKDPCQL